MYFEYFINERISLNYIINVYLTHCNLFRVVSIITVLEIHIEIGQFVLK